MNRLKELQEELLQKYRQLKQLEDETFVIEQEIEELSKHGNV
mgnify:CR=1 FL=1